MFEETLDRLVSDLGLSQGEVLGLARQIANDDTLRTIDRLTQAERQQLIAAIEREACIGAQ